LFLVNPNGIIFGSNASLNIGGSFLATTADSINFANDIKFSAVKPQIAPLLSVNVPIGLQFGQTPGEIRNQANLQVTPNKTLALVGGSINLIGGKLTAPAGRIELGSVAGNNLVSLTSINQDWVLGYKGIENFQDISLSQFALVDTSSDRGGNIQIQGRRVSLTGGSQVFSVAQTRGKTGDLIVRGSELVEFAGTSPNGQFPSGVLNEVRQEATGEGTTLAIETRRLIVKDGAQLLTRTLGRGRGMDLKVNASDSVELLGNSLDGRFPSGLFARVLRGATGEGGTLSIETKRLLVENGAQVSSSTLGNGRAGNLRVRASESVELKGRTPDNRIGSGLFAQVLTGATGDGGDLIIDTKKLDVLGGAQISTAARSGGRGGTLTINAADSILLSGTAAIADDSNRSNIAVSAEPGATRDGGNLTITTGQLTVENGARISADNYGSGKGGNATLNVRRLLIRNGGEVRAGSFATGPGGTLTVNAGESVQVIGFPSTLFTQASASGKAGNLIITTPKLNLQNGAEVTVSATGSGAAGNLTVTANDLRLNRGRLTAETNATEGANISLQNLNLLLMRNQSLISARAFNNANGGNISISAKKGFIVASPRQNNDIIANAFKGQGGKINITTTGIFGFGVRKATPENTTNDIDASSEFGLAGTVTINTPDVDPSRGLIELPANLVDASQQIASGCTPGKRQTNSSFVTTGRGGIPSNPIEPLIGDDAIANWVELNPEMENRTSSSNLSNAALKNPNSHKIVEAQGWIFDANGDVILVAQAPTVNLLRPWLLSTSCHAP
jgi:large exoprotein involved in heme utilization and adhesion